MTTKASVAAAQSFPFISQKRLVKVTDFYPTEKEYNAYLKSYFEDPQPTTVLLIVNSASPKGKGFDLKKAPNVTFVDCGRADEETIKKVEEILRQIDGNIYSYETDTGKNDMVLGNIWLNFAWSGDAVYAMDLAEEEDGISLNFFIPNECANLWFDGWVMPKGAQKQPAQAFVNFLSRPDNAVRNMYYIGYSSVISGDRADETYGSAVLDYVRECYEADPEETDDVILYDLSYFFGENTAFYAETEQALSRQLHAQYPTQEDMLHCAVMDYYGETANENINELWSRIKAESLDAWAIAVLCAAAVLIIAVPLAAKFGKHLEFRKKPKKGYRQVSQKSDEI